MLLDLDAGASFFQLLLDVFGFVLADAFLDRSGHAFDQRLGLFQIAGVEPFGEPAVDVCEELAGFFPCFANLDSITFVQAFPPIPS